MLFVGTPASLLAARYCPQWKAAPGNPEEVPDAPGLAGENQDDSAPVRAPSSLAELNQEEEAESVTEAPALLSPEIRESSNASGMRWEKLGGDVRPREKRAVGYVPWSATWASGKPRDPLAGPSRSSSIDPDREAASTAVRQSGASSQHSQGPDMKAPLVRGHSKPSTMLEESSSEQRKLSKETVDEGSGGRQRLLRGSSSSRNQLWGALARAGSWRQGGKGRPDPSA